MNLKRNEEGVSPVIGVILMVAITVVLAAIVFVLVQNISKPQMQTPNVGWGKNDTNSTLMVVQAPSPALKWSDFEVTGCSMPVDDETVTAGDELTDCVGNVKVTYVPSNSLLYTTTFE